MKVHKIYILGTGPGHKRYIFPFVYHYVEESHIVIGAQRWLMYFDLSGKEVIELNKDMNSIINHVKKNRHKKITVLAGGDPLIYGIGNVFLKYFKLEELHIEVGISSVQYLFTRMGKSLKDFHLVSVHGIDRDIPDIIEKHKHCVFFTDTTHNYKIIAAALCTSSHQHFSMTIGINLSYDNEIILTRDPEFFINADFNTRQVLVVVEREE